MIEPREITEHFRLERVLKSSRSGIVFRAIDPTSQDPVVIKLITPGGPGDQRLGLEHFSASVEALKQIRIPGFPLLLDWGWTPDMSAFMVMELLEGARLDTLAGASPARVLGLITGLMDALEALAAAGIVHGNLAPENLLAVPEEGGEHIAILGFGTAAFRWPTMAPVRWGLESSTADFMAPEWVVPPAGGAPDWRADLYAFAQTACRLLHVDVLDIGDGAPTIALPPDVHEVVPDGDHLEAILTQALEHDPALRPANWSDVRRAFEASTGAAAAVDSSPFRTQRVSSDRPVPAETIRIPVSPTPEPTTGSFADSDDIGRTRVLTPERLSAMRTAAAAPRNTEPAADATANTVSDDASGVPAAGVQPLTPEPTAPEPAAPAEAPAISAPPLIAGWKLERTQAFPTLTTEPAAGDEATALQSIPAEEISTAAGPDVAAILVAGVESGPTAVAAASESGNGTRPPAVAVPPGPPPLQPVTTLAKPDVRGAGALAHQTPLIAALELQRTQAFPTLTTEPAASGQAAVPQSIPAVSAPPAPVSAVAPTLVGAVPPAPLSPTESPAPEEVSLPPVAAAAATLVAEIPSGTPATDATSASPSEEAPQNLAVAADNVAWPTPTPAVPPAPPTVLPVAGIEGQASGEPMGEASVPASTEVAHDIQTPPPAPSPAEIPETTRVVAPAELPAQRPTPPPARARRRWWPWALAACLVIAVIGIGGVLLWQQQEAIATRVRAAARPTLRPPTPMATLRPFVPPAAVAVVDALADALDRGDLKLARQTLDQLTPETRATLPANEATRLGELETAYVAARREQTLRQLKRGLQASDIRMVRDALAGATREDLTLFARDADTAQTVEEARRAADVYSLLQRATAAGNHAETLQEAQTLLQLLAKSPHALEARDKAAAALEAQADTAVRSGQWELATSRLDTIRKFWPDRPGLAVRFERIASEREADDRVERMIAAAGRAEAERQPEKGLDALRAVTPTARTRARWDEARGRLERLLVEVDAASPVVALRPGFKPQYDKGKLATIAVRASDDHAVKEVRIFARIEGGANFQAFPANRGAAGEWTVELAPAFHGNKTVEFYVVATDASGHAGSLGSADAPLRIKKKGWLF